MPHYLAAGTGGYQVFHLRGQDWWWLVFAVACALVGIAAGFIFRRQVLAADPGTPTMVDIAKAIQEGAPPTCGVSSRPSASSPSPWPSWCS